MWKADIINKKIRNININYKLILRQIYLKTYINGNFTLQ